MREEEMRAQLEVLNKRVAQGNKQLEELNAYAEKLEKKAKLLNKMTEFIIEKGLMIEFYSFAQKKGRET